ncbi:LLM class flavin-dependent oxidoreductase [Pseudonocardia sp. H11422]|uniref:LLM class flavin-dependent oxidoreductase n=1 Tax=Pseudonocardia sp. H11422 TaxID=2835866 RepID=UPI001BDD76D4|nr:LLM class flavin-dependent oxidoreductase [Pseudonocardia sp. H11422]
MEFCIGTCAKIDQVGLAKQAEDVGASHFGVGEGPLLFSDPYQYLALAARETSTIKLGTWVTNPLTRIAPVTANSIATLNALAPGRTFLGIGTANNALRSMGNRPATLGELDKTLTIARGLLAGQRVNHTWLGQDREIEFLDKNGHWYNLEDPVEVWMSAGGPKGLAIAAKHADYMTYCLGPNPDMIGAVRRELDKAVAAAGRPPGSVKLVALSWFYQLRPGETWEDGIDKGFGSGPISSCITNSGFMNAHVDELGGGIVKASTEAAMAYLGDPSAPDAPHYLEVWAKYLRGLDPVHRPLITKQLVDYWCLYGTPDELLEKTQLMREAGCDMVSVFLSNPFTAERDIADIGSSILARA